MWTYADGAELAQLLVPDVTTAALDAHAEHQVFQRFSGLTEWRTALLISHRFSTVRMTDRLIAELEPGAPSRWGGWWQAPRLAPRGSSRHSVRHRKLQEQNSCEC